MKRALNILALVILGLVAFFYVTTKSYEQYQVEIDKNIKSTMVKNQKKVENKVDISSQEFRDSLNVKLYGKQNYEDMKDPNMASRIYNSRMNLPTKKEREERKKKLEKYKKLKTK